MAGHNRSILFVCLGNICRSPLAEGIFNATAASGPSGSWRADSAGTGNWHVGEPPHPNSIAVAAKHGIDIGARRCRQLHSADFSRFDVILGMDGRNLADIRRLADGPAHIERFLDFAGSCGDVADPWGSDEAGYRACYETVHGAMPAVMARLVAWPTGSSRAWLRAIAADRPPP